MNTGRATPAGRPPVRRRILSRLAGLVGFVVVAFVMTVYLIERQTREDDFAAVVGSVETLLGQKIAAVEGLMQATVTALETSRSVEDALAARDRDALTVAAGPLFESLRQHHRITHLYFTDPDRVAVLRLHDPGIHGDRIDRFTARRAAETGETAAGIELGPFGTLTLRSVTPWRRDDRRLGFVELGEEITPLLGDTAVSLGVHLYALVRRDLIDRSMWDQGRRMLGRSTGMLEFADRYLVSQSSTVVDPAELALLPDLVHQGAARSAQSEGRTLSMAALPLLDASGRRLGELVVFADRTRAQATFTYWLILAIVVSLGAGAVVFLSFGRALARVDADYRRQHDLELRLLRISSEHERLVQIEKLSAVGTMIGEIAHQLNNPLVGVINMAQLAERSVDKPDRVRELLGEIRRAGQNCSAFVKRMLNFTKVSRFEGRRTDLGTVVDEALALFRQSVGRRSEVELHLPADPVRIVVDPNLLAHALFNLLANAAQAMGGGGRIVLSLEAAAQADGRAGWRIDVEDEGPGMSEETAAKLFTPFFTTRKEGTGLGLAVVRHIALLHEGSVSASNRPEGGARFALWLPETLSTPAA